VDGDLQQHEHTPSKVMATTMISARLAGFDFQSCHLSAISPAR
jgi:hypothetical protein